MNLQIPEEEARKHLLAIPHSTCQKGVDRHWRVNGERKVTAQSVLWLFCWAKTGQNSEAARLASVRAFDSILPVRFADLNHTIDHGYARGARYSLGDIEEEFEQKLGKLGTGGL